MSDESTPNSHEESVEDDPCCERSGTRDELMPCLVTDVDVR